MEDKILLTERKGNVFVLTLNRPKKRNSLSQELIWEIYQMLKESAKDDTIRAVVIQGFGEKAFCSGYDIVSLPTAVSLEMQGLLANKSPLELVLDAIANYPYPTIAMMNGSAYGAGYELAICCDIRVAATDIRIGMPPAKIGLVYPWPGLQRFIQTVGLRVTKEMFFTGDSYEGSIMLDNGMVDYLVPREELEPFTYGLADRISGNAPLSLKGTKRVINLLMSNGVMNEANIKEAETIIAESFNSDDLKEGQMSFLQKRAPQFKGK